MAEHFGESTTSSILERNDESRRGRNGCMSVRLSGINCSRWTGRPTGQPRCWRQAAPPLRVGHGDGSNPSSTAQPSRSPTGDNPSVFGSKEDHVSIQPNPLPAWYLLAGLITRPFASPGIIPGKIHIRDWLEGSSLPISTIGALDHHERVRPHGLFW